jgi:hypothetical protein
MWAGAQRHRCASSLLFVTLDLPPLNKNSFEDFEFHELGEGRRSQINDAVTATRFAYGEDNRAERAVTALRISKLLLSSS